MYAGKNLHGRLSGHLSLTFRIFGCAVSAEDAVRVALAAIQRGESPAATLVSCGLQWLDANNR